MSIDVKAGSFAANLQTNTSTSRVSSGGVSSATVSPDSAQALVTISASNKLTGVQKTGLIKDIAVADRFASKDTNLRKTLLNNVMRNTVVLERKSNVTSEPAMEVKQAAQQFVQAKRRLPEANTENTQAVAQQAQKVSSESNAVSQAEITQRLSQVSKQQVQNVQKTVAEVSVPVKAEATTSAAAPVQDRVEISNAKEFTPVKTEEITFNIPGARQAADFARVGASDYEPPILPGGSGVELEFVTPGSGETADIPLPGSGATEELTLPGSGGIEEIPLPGTVQVEALSVPVAGSGEFVELEATTVVDTAAQIQENPQEAQAAVAEVQLPGRVLSGVEAEEQQVVLQRLLQ